MKRTVKAWAYRYVDGSISGPIYFQKPSALANGQMPVTITYDDGRPAKRPKRLLLLALVLVAGCERVNLVGCRDMCSPNAVDSYTSEKGCVCRK